MPTQMPKIMSENTRILLDKLELDSVEAGVLQQLSRQYADGELDERHAAFAAMAVFAARSIDAMDENAPAYAKAQLMTATVKALEMLPIPERQDASAFDAIRDAITGGEDD